MMTYFDMAQEVITLLPRQIDYIKALQNSFATEGIKDCELKKAIIGGGFGAYNELRLDGLEDLATEIVLFERSEKECSGK